MNREEKINRIKKIVNRINSFCEDMGFDQYEERSRYGIDDFRNYVFDDYLLVEKNNAGGHLEVNIGWYFIPEFDDGSNAIFTDPDKCALEIHIHSDKFQNYFEQVYEGLDHRKENKETRETWNFYPTRGDEDALERVLSEVAERIGKFNHI